MSLVPSQGFAATSGRPDLSSLNSNLNDAQTTPSVYSYVKAVNYFDAPVTYVDEATHNPCNDDLVDGLNEFATLAQKSLLNPATHRIDLSMLFAASRDKPRRKTSYKMLVACVATLATCSAGNAQSTFEISRSRAELTRQRSLPSELTTWPFLTKPVTFAASYFKNTITIWNKNDQPIGQLLGGGAPFTDTTGLVYAFEPNSNTVRIFAPPYTGPPVVIRFGSESVHSLAVDEKDGTFVVITQVPSNGHGRFNFFRRGEVKPCNVVDGSEVYYVNFGSAFDAEGTLFFGGEYASTAKALVGSVAGECAATTTQLYTFTTDISPEVRIAFDKNDNLVVQNWHGLTPLTIFTFAHPTNGIFGKPVSETIPRTYNGVYPQFLAMASDGNHMWAGFLGTTLGYYNYPAGGKPVLLLRDLDGINGIATLPPLIP